MSPLPPADSGLRGLSPTVTFRSGISGDELANGCGDCDGRIVGRDRRECDFRSNPVAAGRAHALCCESRFSQFVKSASQATPDCNRDFHRKGRKRSLQRLHTSLNFQYRRINPCTLSTENGGCTRFRNAEARVASAAGWLRGRPCPARRGDISSRLLYIHSQFAPLRVMVTGSASASTAAIILLNSLSFGSVVE